MYFTPSPWSPSRLTICIATPAGITYHTPGVSDEDTAPESPQFRHQDWTRYPVIASERNCITGWGFCDAEPSELDSNREYHFMVAEVGIHPSRTWQARFVRTVKYRLQTFAHVSKTRPHPSELSIPTTCPATSSSPGCWIKSPEGYGAGRLSRGCIRTLEDLKLYELFRGFSPHIGEH